MDERKAVRGQAVDLAVEIVADAETAEQKGDADGEHAREDRERADVGADLLVQLLQGEHMQSPIAKAAAFFQHPWQIRAQCAQQQSVGERQQQQRDEKTHAGHFAQQQERTAHKTEEGCQREEKGQAPIPPASLLWARRLR